MAGKKSASKTNDEWQGWGNGFGAGYYMPGRRRHSLDIAGIMFGLFVLSWGVAWIGNEFGWWNVVFPFWAVVVIFIGLAILLSAIRNSF